MAEEEQKDTTQEQEEEQAEEQSEPSGVVLKFEDESAQQEWLDRQFSGRYKRKQKEIREDVRSEIQKELEAQQAKEQGNYQKLYEAAEATVNEQAAKIKELESQAGDISTRDERIEALESRVKGFIEPDLARVPEHYRELVAEMNLDRQAAWLTKNRELLMGPDDPIGSPATPPPPRRDTNRDRREEDKAVAEATRHSILSKL